MKTLYLTKDAEGQLHVCGTDEAAIEWEKSKGRAVIGKIETELDILAIRDYVCGNSRRE